jgi:hypothetical protein
LPAPALALALVIAGSGATIGIVLTLDRDTTTVARAGLAGAGTVRLGATIVFGNAIALAARLETFVAIVSAFVGRGIAPR